MKFGDLIEFLLVVFKLYDICNDVKAEIYNSWHENKKKQKEILNNDHFGGYFYYKRGQICSSNINCVKYGP